ncbi:MAG: T9SS type A sorting domain-containing protein, partial [Ignavibacteriae bacterium]|nr:T9SS type A sorting domain-containing protein [Ignavibacteriota bacterium]
QQNVELKIYDVLGREVITLLDEIKAPGTYEVQFNANTLASGTYFYRLQVGDKIETKKMVLLK